MNVEDCFKSCNVFGRLRECHFEDCRFRTTENDKLSIHMMDHSPSAEAPPETAKIQIEHLQEALRKALGTQNKQLLNICVLYCVFIEHSMWNS